MSYVAIRERCQRAAARDAAALVASGQEDRVNWVELSPNPFAASLLVARPSKIHWPGFSANSAPEAIALLEANLTRVDRFVFSGNVGAISVLTKHTEIIDWDGLLGNANGGELLRAYPDQYALAVRKHNSSVWSCHAFHSLNTTRLPLPLIGSQVPR